MRKPGLKEIPDTFPRPGVPVLVAPMGDGKEIVLTLAGPPVPDPDHRPVPMGRPRIALFREKGMGGLLLPGTQPGMTPTKITGERRVGPPGGVRPAAELPMRTVRPLFHPPEGTSRQRRETRGAGDAQSTSRFVSPRMARIPEVRGDFKYQRSPAPSGLPAFPDNEPGASYEPIGGQWYRYATDAVGNRSKTPIAPQQLPPRLRKVYFPEEVEGPNTDSTPYSPKIGQRIAPSDSNTYRAGYVFFRGTDGTSGIPHRRSAPIGSVPASSPPDSPPGLGKGATPSPIYGPAGGGTTVHDGLERSV
jgi:hypothetical protein